MIPMPPWASPKLIAAGLVAAAFGLLLVALLLTRADLRAAEAELTALQERHDTLTEQLESARTSATGWQVVALEAQGELNARIERDRIQRERDAAAVAEARRIAAEADAALAAWIDRYEQATRNAECAAQLSKPICPTSS